MVRKRIVWAWKIWVWENNNEHIKNRRIYAGGFLFCFTSVAAGPPDSFWLSNHPSVAEEAEAQATKSQHQEAEQSDTPGLHGWN